MRILEITYSTSWYINEEKHTAKVRKRLAVADEYADKLLALDFSVGSFPEWAAVKTLEYTLLYIEKLKDCFFNFGSITNVKEVKDYEPLREPEE